jgi:hypothetical protein
MALQTPVDHQKFCTASYLCALHPNDRLSEQTPLDVVLFHDRFLGLSKRKAPVAKFAALTSRPPPKLTKPVESFKAGDRVRFAGAGKDWIGVVSERKRPDGSKSIHPHLDDTAIYVTFDETGASVPVAAMQLEKTSVRGR